MFGNKSDKPSPESMVALFKEEYAKQVLENIAIKSEVTDNLSRLEEIIELWIDKCEKEIKNIIQNANISKYTDSEIRVMPRNELIRLATRFGSLGVIESSLRNLQSIKKLIVQQRERFSNESNQPADKKQESKLQKPRETYWD